MIAARDTRVSEKYFKAVALLCALDRSYGNARRDLNNVSVTQLDEWAAVTHEMMQAGLMYRAAKEANRLATRRMLDGESVDTLYLLVTNACLHVLAACNRAAKLHDSGMAAGYHDLFKSAYDEATGEAATAQ